MSTNYYLEAPAACECCGRPYDALHIGKSSYGWTFALHVMPDIGLNSLDAWIAYIVKTDARIIDEYGRVIFWRDLLNVITNRKFTDLRTFNDADLVRMGAELAPDGLLRSKIDGVHCVGHGPGTWDLIAGKFC